MYMCRQWAGPEATASQCRRTRTSGPSFRCEGLAVAMDKLSVVGGKMVALERAGLLSAVSWRRDLCRAVRGGKLLSPLRNSASSDWPFESERLGRPLTTPSNRPPWSRGQPLPTIISQGGCDEEGPWHVSRL